MKDQAQSDAQTPILSRRGQPRQIGFAAPVGKGDQVRQIQMAHVLHQTVRQVRQEGHSRRIEHRHGPLAQVVGLSDQELDPGTQFSGYRCHCIP